MNDNEITKLYNALISKGYSTQTLGDEQTFMTKMGDANNRKKLYDYVSSQGNFRIGDYDTYERRLAGGAQASQPDTYPQEVVDRYNSPNNKPGSFKDMAALNREYQQMQKTKADVQAEEAARVGQFGNGNMVSTPNGMMPDLRGAGRRVRAQQPATQQPVQQEQPQPQQPQVEYPFEAQQNVGDQMWDIAHMHDNEKLEKPRFDYRHAESGFVNPATQKSDDRQTFTEGLKRAKEDDEILKQVTLKPEETADDVYENAMMRFSNTEEGIAMQNEADEAMHQHLATLRDEFTRSKEYKNIVSQKPTTEEEAAQMTEQLNQAFQEKYGAEMEKFMQPYQEKMMEAVQNRYGESISEGMRKVNAKAAGQQVTDLQSQVNELQAKRGQTGSGTLRAANHLLEETQEVIDAANRGDTGFLKELGRGFWDNLDARNFTWGISDALDATNLKIALDAAEKGEQLSKEQEALLDAHAVNMIVSAYFGSDLSRGYKAGQMTAESLPFMLDIITNPISASGNAVAKGLLKYGMKRFGAKAVNRAVPRFLGRVAGESVAAAGMTSTTGLPRVLGETMDRLNANFNVTIGDDGKPQVQRVDNKSTMEALSEAVRSNFFEYQSESVFNALRGFNPLKGMMSRVMPEPVNKIIGAVKSSGVGKVYRNTIGNQTVKEVADRAQFHGLWAEYMEEVYNNFANVATGDMSLEDATDLDKNIDTFLGLAPTSVLFGAIGVGGYAYERYQNRKNMNRAFGQMNDQQREQLAQLQEMAAGNQKEAINREVKRFLQETIAADNLTQEEKRAEIEYLFEFVKQNAIGEIDTERTPEERAVDDAEESRMAGYDTTEPETMNEAKNDYEAALADMENSFSPESIAAIDANPVEELRLTYMNPSYSDEDRQRVLDYVNAKQRYDGMVQRVRDDIDGMIQASDAEIDSQVNTGTGMVQPATLKVDNRQVHIIDGNVALLEDGSIDTANSTQDIIVRDAQTGKVEFVSPSAFLGVDEAMDPAALKQQAAENIRQTKAQQAADQIDGVLPFQQGDTYDGVDAEGQPVQVQIISDNGDGTVNVGINGEAAGVPMQKEAVQQLVDNARRAQAVARREDAASQRAKNTNLSEPSRSMTEGRDAYSLNEEIGVILPDGSIGSAVINAEQNADGQYEVELRDEAGNPVGVQLLTADQLNVMQPAEEQAEAEQQPAPTKEAVSSDLNGEQEQPAEQAAETPSVEATPEVVPQNDTIDAMPMIGEGEDMEPDFAHATPQRTQQYLYEESGLEQDEADDFVKDMKKRAQAEKTKLEGKKPKLSDRGIDNKIPRFQRAKAEWQGKVDEAQRKVDYWNSVEQEQAMKQRQAREAAEAERLAAMTDEERLAQQRLTEQDAQNLEEIAAQMIGSGSIKLNRDSYKQETGYSESEAKKMFRIFANDGMSVSRAGEQIEQAAREAGIPFDETDANAGRNAVISVLQSAETWGDLLHYIEKNRQAEADALLRAAEREQEELLDRLAVAYNFASGEDYRAYEEFYLPMYLSELDAATGEEYYAAIADDINHLNEIENGERTDNSEGEGSPAVLPEEQPSVGNRESTVEGQVESEGSTGEVPSEERPASEEASRGEVEIAPSDQLKPTDLRDSVKPDEAKLKPIGRGVFGNIYDQFKGKVKEALDFLLKHKSGDLLGVFHRDGFGDIDLVWGSKDEEKGLDHIIDKHVNKLKDFASAEEAISVIDDVINNGRIIKDKWDKATFEKDGYRVVVSKNTRDGNGQIVDNDKRWVVTAFDNSKTEKEKATSATTRVTPDSTSGSRAVAPDVASSGSKDSTSSDNIQENQQENEEQIEKELESRIEVQDLPTWPEAVTENGIEYHERVVVDGKHNVLKVDAPDEKGNYTGSYYLYEGKRFGSIVEVVDYIDGKQSVQQQIEAARQEVDTNPTEAQKEAGNYKKGHIKLDGYDITIENPKGSTRSGVDEQGKEWSVTMNNDYGYLRGTEGVDGDHIDVFLSDEPTDGNVFVVDQVKPDGSFDEHKVMYGFATADEARAAYLANYSPGWTGLGAITEVSKDEFKKWVESSHRKTKPFAEYKSVKSISGQNEASVVRGEGYTITPTIYKKKSGGMLDMQLVKFDKLTPEQKKTLSGLARQMKGWWSREDEGFLMRSMEDAESLTNAVQAPTQEVTPAEEQKQEPQSSGNKLVTYARYEELKERMRKKLGGQMNLGIDPEILTIGIEMAVYHIEKGSRKFADYAKAMIADLGDAIRPYLKAFYNGARDLPEVEQAGWNTEMDSADNVSRFDVANFDKPSIDAMATAEEVTKEQEVKQQAEEAVSQVTSIAEQPKLRPATEEDLEGNPAVYYKGRRYRIVMLMRQGSQVSATEFEKPRITSVVLTNMESVSPSELMVEDTPASTPVDEQPKNDEAKPKESKKKPVKKAEKAQPMSLDLFAQFDAENEPVNNEENNRNNEENSVTSQSEVSGDELAARRWFRTRVFDALLESLQTGEKPFRNITELRSLAIKQGMKVDLDGRTDILLQELVEDALVRAARRVVESGRYGTGKQTFDAIVQLYDMQPTIAQRSSNRIKMQQYSTPIPMAYVADMFVRRASNQLGLEPTAGNGMLVFALPAGTIHANELDETRLSNLREQGFSAVTQQDATQPFDITDYDFVVANPPFGSAAAKDYDGKMIGGLEEQIALNALASMKDDGRAAIIIGGNMEYAKNGSVAGNKAFWTYLYDHYNVKGVVDMEGKLFQKQGTTFPTRMILIDGRRSAEERAQTTVYPPVKDAAVPKVSTFDELYDTVEIIRKSKDKTNGTEILRTRERELVSGDNNTSGSTERSGRGEQHRPDDTQLGRSEQERSSTESQRPVSRTDRADNGAGTTGSTTEGNQPRDSRGIPAADTRRVDGVGVPQNRVGLTQQQPKKQEKRNLDTEKLSYRPHNSAFSLQSVAPAAMVEAMDKVLSDIEKKYGAIDEFVRSELDYTTIEEAHQALAAEQMDSVAMAIYQMKQGQAMIIGDQTGVGKGRQMAALIRWAVKRGEKPIFITQKADLFSDIYRDLVDVGSGDLNPFIFNSDGAMVDAKGNTVHKPLSSAEMKKVFDSGELPDEYDFAVLTYSQVNTGDHQSQEEAKEAAKKNGQRTKKSAAEKNAKATPKATFLRKIAKDNYLLLDESHTAAGQSNTGAYLQSLLRDAKAATFASATFAKRPDTMPMYAIRTAMSAAKVKPEDMIKIIEKGGVTLQEIMSRALTEAGQMVRRERDMSDVKTDWKTINDEATVKRARENYDKTIAAFNRIIKFQEDYVKPRIEELNAALAITAESAGIKKGTDKMGVANVPFASKTYNYTKQLMLALKVDAIIDEVEAEIKAGRHPVIALESTMESSIKEYAPGEIISEPTFSASLLKGLDSVMQYTVTDQDGKERHEHYTPKSLGEAGEKAYYELQDFIRESTKDIYISPLDAIITGLNAKGYKVGELTGRSSYLEVNEEGKSVVRRRMDKDKKKMQREFNNGTLDVLILNKSASTGISLHASEKFTDQRQRSMIIAQPLSDINDYMQMIGRIDRTGQVHRGYYINLGLPVPAENRFLMMLSTKLKSLNANTTTSQDSENNDVEAPDLLNKYGSRVVVEYLRDNPDIYIKMGEPLKSGGMGGKKTDASQLDEYIAQEDDARRITGYVALLSTDEQDAFYDEVVRRYNDLMRYLNDTGNNDLKITVMPLKAKTLEKRLSSEGKDPSGSNPFAGNAYVEKVEMDVLRKPMKAAEIRKTIELKRQLRRKC